MKERIDSLEEQIRVKQTTMTEELKKEISSFVRHEVKRILAEQQKGKDNLTAQPKTLRSMTLCFWRRRKERRTI